MWRGEVKSKAYETMFHFLTLNYSKIIFDQRFNIFVKRIISI
jgi:hypothetical protein